VAHTHSSLPLARTPLFDLIVQQKARFTEFSGWEMPVQFSGLKQEHEAVRSKVGLFDISHMGKFTLQGVNLLQLLQPLLPSDLEKLQPGQAQYSVLLNPEGGIIDDIIVYYQGTTEAGEQRAVIIVNAATKDKDKAWIISQLENIPLSFVDLSAEKVLIAIQGPEALTVLQPFVKDNLSPIPAFGHLETEVLGSPAFVARTGYTGEDGFEVMLDPQIGKQLWQTLSQQGVTPCGLGARDTLRLEAAMALYGQDMDDSITPLEAGLGWLVHLDRKGDFLGRSRLEQQKAQGLTKRLVGIQTEGRHIARHGYSVLFEGKVVGEVTSGTISPTLGIAIALAYVPPALGKIGQALEIEIRGKAYPAQVVKKPFYRSSNKP
jgi:aminomethyltransferase